MVLEKVKTPEGDLPVSFALRIAYFYEREFRRAYLEDVMRLGASFESLAATESYVSLPVALCADIFWAAFKTGAAVSKADFAFGPEDVAEWVLNDPGMMSNLLEMLMRSFPNQDASMPTAASSDGPKKNPRLAGTK